MLCKLSILKLFNWKQDVEILIKNCLGWRIRLKIKSNYGKISGRVLFRWTSRNRRLWIVIWSAWVNLWLITRSWRATKEKYRNWNRNLLNLSNGQKNYKSSTNKCVKNYSTTKIPPYSPSQRIPSWAQSAQTQSCHPIKTECQT